MNTAKFNALAISPRKFSQIFAPFFPTRRQKAEGIQVPIISSVAVAGLGFWLLSAILTTIPARSAERIAVVYGPIQFSLSVESLEALVKEGKVTEELSSYIGQIDPKNLTDLREIMQRRFEANPTVISQFTKAQLGQTVLERLGRVLQTEQGQNGANSLRTAFIAAAGDPEGLNLLNMLRRFPDRIVRVDLTQGLQIIGEFEKILRNTEASIKLIQQTSIAEASANSSFSFSQLPDLRRPGSFTWQQETLTINDTERNRPLMVDLYLPKTNTPANVIVISHGAAGNRNTLSLLATHLASYGFAIVVMEHQGDSLKRFQDFFTGLADSPQPQELIYRPLEIKYVLDELQRREQTEPALKGRLNLQQVGVIGQSIGGYTSLALAGAKINFDLLRKDCLNNQIFNLSLLVQCEISRLTPANYELRDDRIKAVIAINPLTSSIFGETGLGQIQIPVMFVAGSADIFTPAFPEQIAPFTWLTTPNKYLVVIENASHFSLLGGREEDNSALPPFPRELVGPDPALARPYLNALSVAFFKTYLTNQPEFQPFLSANYARTISQLPFNLSLVEKLTAEQLTEALNNNSSNTVKPKNNPNR
ncbi:alpha/beta hydrolase [Phormidium sp. LEGE 05292]|uniref:alpha/beta hydrolase n=1 Tax=[Phormidium] sp. LEGE 05292 TaxID=767427 RepID=UPI00187E8DF1|nr:alpha/beta hydrolase [Phormidium sp. LEGE 05292]MBE9225130.1 alpha/beta hydrolase [Phormidium sp. LEGE 05292]